MLTISYRAEAEQAKYFDRYEIDVAPNRVDFGVQPMAYPLVFTQFSYAA